MCIGGVAWGVDTTWIFDGDGNWNEAAKWSAGEPVGSTYNVLIDDGDTAVTVTLNATRLIGELSLGANDSLRIESLGASSIALTSVNAISNDGSISLIGAGSGGATLAVNGGALVNGSNGNLRFLAGGTGGRFLTGDLVNNGNLEVNQTTTFNKPGGVYTNNGDVSLTGTAPALTVTGGGRVEQLAGTFGVHSRFVLDQASTLNLRGGQFNVTSGGDRIQALNGSAVNLLSGGELNLAGAIYMNQDAVFTQNGGTLNYQSNAITGGIYDYRGGAINGAPSLDGVRLRIDPAATAPVTFNLKNGNNNILSDINAGQTLIVHGGPITDLFYYYDFRSSTGFTNHGSILFTEQANQSSKIRMRISSGTLVNSPTGLIHYLAGGNGTRLFLGSLENQGTLLIDRSLNFQTGNAGLLRNLNQISIANGQTLDFQSSGTLENAAGLMDVKGSLALTLAGTLKLTGGEIRLGGTEATPATLNISGAVFQQTGGTFTYDALTTNVINGGTYDFQGGTVVGSPRLKDGKLIIGPSATGSAAFTLTNSNTLAGDVHAGQTLQIDASATGSGYAVTSATGFTNDGSILMSSFGTSTTYLVLTTGTLTNSPTGLLHFQATTGNRVFRGNLINRGTVLVNRSVTFDKAGGSYLNEGEIAIGSGITLTINGGLLEQTSGTIDVDGTLTMGTGSETRLQGGLLDISGTFNRTGLATLSAGGVVNLKGSIGGGGTLVQDGGTLNCTTGKFGNGVYQYLGGTVTGTPVLLNATLIIGPDATSSLSFLFECAFSSNANVLGSSIHAGQTVTVQNVITNAIARGITLPTGIINSGTLRLSATGSGSPTLTVTSGALTNSATGRLQFLSDSGGSRVFTGDLVNGGVVEVYKSTNFQKTDGTYINNKQFTVSASGTLSINNGGIFAQAAGVLDVNGNLSRGANSQLKLVDGVLNLKGTMSGSGVFTQVDGTLNYTTGGSVTGGTFEYLGGTINGTPKITNTKLVIGPTATAAVAFTLEGNNTLAGDVHAGQVLTVQNLSNGQGLTSIAPFTNNGSLLLDAKSSGLTILSITGGGLTNAAGGLLHFRPAGLGTFQLTGDLINHGMLTVDRSTTFNKVNGVYTNDGQWTIAQSLSITGGGTFQQTAGATVVKNTLSATSAVKLLGGTLSGKGTIAAPLDNISGVLTPGESYGQLTVQGAYTQQAGGRLDIDLSGLLATQFDVLNIIGAASLGGTLNVNLLAGYMPTNGASFDILNWTTRTGTFATVNLPGLTAGLFWNTTRLYTTGTLSVTDTFILPGDFDGDSDVDGADFVAWQTNFPKSGGATLAQGDADADGDVDGADFVVWQTNFPFTPTPGASPVPEPASVFMISTCAIVMALWRTCRFKIK